MYVNLKRKMSNFKIENVIVFLVKKDLDNLLDTISTSTRKYLLLGFLR
jgi:hypothetical protein